MASEKPPPWGAAEIVRMVDAGTMTSCEVLDASLARLREVERHVRAFATVNEAAARLEAERLDRQFKMSGRVGPLHGVVIGIKDVYDVEGLPTKLGTAAFDDAPGAERDALTVGRLRRAGAVVLGKTTTHELAFGVRTEPTCNPWDLDRIPGGSSGGSAAAVAAGVVPIATGSDTGGSVRIPAAACGVVGIKPSYGWATDEGVTGLSYTMDHLGVLAASVQDAALAMFVMAGQDQRAEAAFNARYTNGTGISSLSKVRFGVPRELVSVGPLAADVASVFTEVCERLKAVGVEIEEISIPELEPAVAAQYVILLAEASSYHETLPPSRIERLSPRTQGLLELGAKIPATLYLRAQRCRQLLIETTNRTMRDRSLDGLLSPTLPADPPLHGEFVMNIDGVEEETAHAFVRQTGAPNMTGAPAITLPVGLSRRNLPVALHVSGVYGRDTDLLEIASLVEAELGGPGRATVLSRSS